MNKKILVVLLAISAVAIILFTSTSSFGLYKLSGVEKDISFNAPLFSFPTLENKTSAETNTTSPSPINEDPLKAQAWATFENYLQFAKAHNLAGVRSLSYQISDTCNDPAKEKDCFALMDGVYNFSTIIRSSDFTHMVSDDRQILLYTDGPTVAMLFFTRDNTVLKVLSLRFCFEDENTKGTCVKLDSIKNDQDNDGWWDITESLFYK